MPSTLASLLTAHSAAAPDRPALHLLFSKQPDHTLTYRGLLEAAAGYARAYAQAGLLSGDVIVLIQQHGPGLAAAFWGAILHGAIPAIMPFLTEKLAPEKYRDELAALVAITRPAGLVTYREFAPEVHAALAPDSPVRAVLLESDVAPDPAPDPAALLGLSRAPDDMALLQHSSGTTGLQKGVALSHRAVLNQLDTYAAALRLADDDVVVSWLPLYHDMGLIAGFVMPVLRRIPLVLLSPFDWVRAPFRLMQAVTRYRGTLSWLPNFAYNFCAQKIRERDLEGVDLSTLRAVINCSEPMRWESHQAFLDRFAPYGLRPSALATCYAMAENVFAVTQGGIGAPVTVDEVDRFTLLSDKKALPMAREGSDLNALLSASTESDELSAPRSASGAEGSLVAPLPLQGRGRGLGLKLLSAGPPLPNVQVRILDEQRAELPERHIGEIALRSDCMLTGYYHRPDLTERAFHDGWYLTGDLGYLAAGELYITGRIKDLIIVGGKNVHPQDLESLAGEVPGVHPGRVVAFGVLNPDQGTEEVVLVAEVDTDNEDARAQLANDIRQHINRGSDVAVRYVHLVGPRWVLKTSSGKLARAANREKYLAEVANVS